LFRESDECEMKVDKEGTKSLQNIIKKENITYPSFVGSYTTAL